MTQGIANGPTLTYPTAEKASFTGCSMQHTRLVIGFIHTLDSSHQFYAKNQITKPMWLKTPRGAGHVEMTCLQPLIHPNIINIYIIISISLVTYHLTSLTSKKIPKGLQDSPWFPAIAVCMAWLLPLLWLSAADAKGPPLLIGGVEFSHEDDIEACSRQTLDDWNVTGTGRILSLSIYIYNYI
jgi:hypothetical protein